MARLKNQKPLALSMASASTYFTRACAFSAITAIIAWWYLGSLLQATILFAALTTISASIWGITHWQQLSLALDATPLRILSWVVFISSCVGFTILFGLMSVPTGWGIGLSLMITLYLWWSYYSLEPARA
jgi:hypothetical protein